MIKFLFRSLFAVFIAICLNMIVVKSSDCKVSVQKSVAKSSVSTIDFSEINKEIAKIEKSLQKKNLAKLFNANGSTDFRK